jgi:N-acylneuraminate cytidylyltransferase
VKIPSVILARGGSKGIPGKNLKTIDGESLISLAVNAAKDSKLNPVFVYSDSNEILSESEQCGAIPVERPESVSDDNTTSETSMISFIKSIDPNEKYSAFALQQCTTPFMSSRYLDDAYDMMADEDVDSVITATRFEHFLGYEEFDRPRTFIPLTPYRSLRQKMDSVLWMENGGLYLSRRPIWLSGKRLGRNCRVVPMPWWESVEIDDPIDLSVCRKIFECMRSS